MLTEGELAPGFTLPDQTGHPVSLSDLRGQTHDEAVMAALDELVAQRA
jgi:peroxiredoxin